MPGIKPDDCQPGDIVLFYGLNLVSAGLFAAKAAKYVTVLPAVVSATQGGSNAFIGSATANHAGIVCGDPEGPGLQLAHATNKGGIHRAGLRFSCVGAGTLQVFRLVSPPGLAAEAGKVASTWAKKHEGTMEFATGKAALSALQSSSFGPGRDTKRSQLLFRQDSRGRPVRSGRTF